MPKRSAEPISVEQAHRIMVSQGASPALADDQIEELALNGYRFGVSFISRSQRVLVAGLPSARSMTLQWDLDEGWFKLPDPCPIKEGLRRSGQLTRLFREGTLARFLNEEDDSAAHEEGASGESLDAQVDRYFGQYEADAKKVDSADPTVDQMESLDWRDLCKGVVILEAGEGDKDADDPDDAAPGADALTGQATKPGLEAIDVEKFANDVVRLVKNYDSLLEVRSTLLRRATSFLKKSYDDEAVQAFEDTLRDDHGMEAGASSDDVAAEKFPAPSADRASGSAEPGAGGPA